MDINYANCPMQPDMSPDNEIDDSFWGVNNTCSYCGSMHPNDFMQAVRSGVNLTPTDKSYKVYVEGQRKFYFEHLSVNQRVEFMGLYAKGLVKMTSDFYMLPFFMGRANGN